MTNASTLAATLGLALLGGTFTWWALKFGAYFGTVMYPGVTLLGIGSAVLVFAAPWRASLALSARTRIALIGLVALATWSALSALWSPTPDIAVEDAQRMIGYALCFGLGIWTCVLLEHRMELSVLPVVVAAGLVALVTLITLAVASGPGNLLDEDGGTLQYPLGYRNANAAFFLIAFWPAVCLASSAGVARAVRIGAFVTATGCFEVAILCQSRGTILAFAVGAIVLLISSPARVVTLTRMTAVLPAIPCFFAASALFQTVSENPGFGQVTDEINIAGILGLAGLAVSLVLSLFVVGFVRSPKRPVWATRNRLRALLAAGLLAIVGLLALQAHAIGEGVSDKADEFLSGGADLRGESNRFALNAGSGRVEIWRVAIGVAETDPVFGDGGGGFQFRHNREREDPNQLARDAHSVELEMFSELGGVGVALFATVIIAAFAAAVRTRKLGPSAAMLASGALAAGAYWLVHASIDWFWPYPAVTAPVFALLGAAAAPTLLMPRRTGRPRGRRALLALIVVFTLTLVPPFVSQSLVERSFETFRSDAGGTYRDLDLARNLNPLSDAPALTEGSIALALEDEERAIDAFREATRVRPEEYVGHFFLALLYTEAGDPEAARAELAQVEELNPLEQRIGKIRKGIEAAERDAARSPPSP